MVRKKKKITPLQQEAKKQITRLKRAIARYEKQGFDVTFKIPQQQKITKKYVEKLKATSYRNILQQSYKVNIDTGEVTSGWTLRVNPPKDKEKYTSYKQAFTTEQYAQSVIDNFKSYLSNYPDKIFYYLRNFIDEQITKHGSVKVAATLLTNNDSQLETYLKIYSSTQAIEEFSTTFINDLESGFDVELSSFEGIFDEAQ
ncbi:hypothetical protein J6Q66_09000 [bacterium]|nr:hypothetical protein [bacterium]